ncbi:MAG: hypothetical protein ACYTFO_02715 [Planctomycetota bacterium]
MVYIIVGLSGVVVLLGLPAHLGKK